MKLGNRCFLESWLHTLVTKRHFILIMVGTSSHVFCLDQALLAFGIHISAHFFKLFDRCWLNGLAGPWFRLGHVRLFHDSPCCLRPHNRLLIGVFEAWVLVQANVVITRKILHANTCAWALIQRFHNLRVFEFWAKLCIWITIFLIMSNHALDTHLALFMIFTHTWRTKNT